MRGSNGVAHAQKPGHTPFAMCVFAQASAGHDGTLQPRREALA